MLEFINLFFAVSLSCCRLFSTGRIQAQTMNITSQWRNGGTEREKYTERESEDERRSEKSVSFPTVSLSQSLSLTHHLSFYFSLLMIFSLTLNLQCLYVCAVQIYFTEQSSLISLITYWPPLKPFKVITGERACDCVCVCVCNGQQRMMFNRGFMRMGSQ